MLESRLLLAAELGVRFEFADASQNLVQELRVGDNFYLRGYVRDIASDQNGLFQAYFDVAYDSSLVSTRSEAIQYGPAYNLFTDGITSAAGIIKQVGGTDSNGIPPELETPPKSFDAEFLLFSVPMRADHDGPLNVSANLPATPTPPSQRRVLFHNLDTPSANQLQFTGGSITIVGAGINVSPTSGLTTSEGGGQATFQVVLTRQPAANVTIGLSSSNVGEGTVSPSTISFSTTDWNTPRTVTVTGTNDSMVDGNKPYTIFTAPAVSSDPNYSGRNADDVSLTNLDDDTARLTTTAPTITETNADQTVNFAVSLDRAVLGGFTVAFSATNGTAGAGDYASVTTSPLTFSGTAGETKNIAVTIKGDQVVEGNETFTITLGTVTPLGAVPAGSIVSGASATGTINNDDSATLSIVAPSITETNADQTVNFTVSLDKAVSGGFTVAFSAASGTASAEDYGLVTTSPLTFSGTAGETKNIPVTIRGDQIVEGNETFSLTLGTVTPLGAVPAGSIVSGASATGTINNDDSATLSIVAPSITETNADQTVNFTVSLDKAVSGGFSVAFSATNGTAGAGDYTLASTSPLTFSGTAGETKNIPVTIRGDQIVEGNETFSLTLGTVTPLGAVPASSIVTDASATGTINNDDTATLSIVAPSITETNADQTVNFTVSLDKAVSGGFAVAFSAANGTASAEDYGLVTTSPLTFSGTAGETKNIAVTIKGDQVVEGNETFAITLGTVTPLGAAPVGSIVTGASAAGTINNDDTATLSIVAPSITETNADQTVNFTVSLDKIVSGGFTVTFSAANGTASAGDYGLVTASPLTFSGTAGETKNIAVTIKGDQIVEGNETFTITLGTATPLGAASSGSIVTGTSATGAINNDDTATLSIVAPSITETNADQTVNFTVSLDKAVSGGFTVAFTAANGTASAGDYGLVTASPLTFSGTAGETKNIAVTIKGDQIVEGDETFSVMLGQVIPIAPVQSGSIVTGASAVGTIRNDDAPPLLLTAVTASQPEGSGSGTTEFVFEVKLSEPILDADGFNVAYTTNDGTAMAASGDYVDNDGSLHFDGSAGETKTIRVLVNRDLRVEGDETLQIALGPVTGLPPGTTLPIAGSPATATIRNDDSATLTLAAVSAAGPEGNSAPPAAQTFAVTLAGEVEGGFRVAYRTDDGTATAADSDYQDVDGSLAFAGAANESHLITVSVNPDLKVEPDETFSLSLGALSEIGATIAAAIQLAGSPVVGTIQNDDQAVLTLTGPPAIEEGTGGAPTAFVFQVALSAAVQGGLQLAYTTNDGTATAADGDYLDNDSQLTFAGTAGEVQSITVLVSRDVTPEPDESFAVTLGAISALAGVAAGDLSLAGSPATATILNDDFPRLELRAVTASQPEGSGGGTTEFVFEVRLSDPVADPDGFDVAYTTSDGTATLASGDYVDNDGTLHFDGTAGETKSIRVLVHRDGRVEADETVQVLLGEIAGLAAGITVLKSGSPSTATIRNDDTATLTLATVAAAAIEDTGGAAAEFNFTVAFSGEVESGFRVDYATNDRTATLSGADYVDNDGSLTFDGTSGEVRSITVRANADATVEADETFQVVLGALSGIDSAVAASIQIVGSPLTATILNDDKAVLTLTGPAPTKEGTGGTPTPLVFQVALSAPVQGGFQLGYTTDDGTARALDGDYVDNDGQLVFSGTANETRAVTVQVQPDATLEPDENLAVTLRGLLGIDPSMADDITFAASPASATILNDDDTTLTITTPAAVAEGTGGEFTDVSFTVTLAAAVQGGLRVTYMTDDGTARVADGDYEDNDGVLTFAGLAGETKTITVRVRQDSRVERTESFSVCLGAVTRPDGSLLDGVVVVGCPAEGRILNDDQPRLALAAAAPSLTEGTGTGTTPYTFSVTLLDAVPDEDGFDVAYATNDGSATAAGNDYTDNDGLLNFAGTAGETKSITVMVTRDATVEPDESFQVVLGQTLGMVDGISPIVQGSPATGQIADDDSATLTLTAGSASKTEGTGGSTTDFTFSVALSHAVQGGFAVGYTTDDGTAKVADGDYADNDGSLVFVGTAGETKSIVVRVQPDAVVETDESFRVRLGSVSGGFLGLAGRVTIAGNPSESRILDDDTASLAITGPAAQAEGTGGANTDFVFQVRLSAGVQGGLRVNYTTDDGSATLADSDYEDNDGQLSFTGTAGETREVRVRVKPDARVEREETFAVALKDLSGVSDSGVASRIAIPAGPQSARITNDDSARVSFAAASGTVIEAAGNHSTNVNLRIGNGGTLSEAVTVNIVDQRNGSATTPGDYTLATTAVTFPAGSRDGDTRPVILTTVVDSSLEPDETVNLRLTVAGDGIGGGVTAQAPDGYALTIVDDPMSASLSGTVWVDANNNGLREDNEARLPGVIVTLTGRDVRGQTVEIVTMTDGSGGYRFAQLPGGTYDIVEEQPKAFYDAGESLGTVNGAASGVMHNDRFVGIVLAPAASGSGFNFGEWGLRAKYVSRRMQLASTPPADQMLREQMARAEEQEGDAAKARAIRQGQMVEMRRIGSKVEFTDTSADDVFQFHPAVPGGTAERAEHRVEANGLVWKFAPAQATSFRFTAASGNDQIQLSDSAGNDTLNAANQTADLQGPDYRAEAIAFERVRAASQAGGADTVNQAAIDFVLELEGDWTGAG